MTRDHLEEMALLDVSRVQREALTRPLPIDMVETLREVREWAGGHYWTPGDILNKLDAVIKELSK